MVEQRYRTTGLVLLATLTLGVLSACSTTASPERRGLQRAAVERWTHCIERHSTERGGPLAVAVKHVDRRCDGHRRDVLAVHSPHLQNRIEALLSQRAEAITAARLVRIGHRDYPGVIEDARFETLKNSLQ